MSIFSNDMMLARATNHKQPNPSNIIQLKGNEIQLGFANEINDKKAGNLLGNK